VLERVPAGGKYSQLTNVLLNIRRRAPNARIVMLGYPRFFRQFPTSACQNISPADQDWINRKIHSLDVALQRSVASRPELKAEFVRVESAFDGHEVCTRDSWSNGLARVGQGGNFWPKEYSFHPNGAGQAALAARVMAQLRRPAP
jgi:hypothetical protein